MTAEDEFKATREFNTPSQLFCRLYFAVGVCLSVMNPVYAQSDTGESRVNSRDVAGSRSEMILRNKNSFLEKELEELGAELANVRNEKEEIESRFTDLSYRLRTAEKEVELQNAELSALKSELESLKSRENSIQSQQVDSVLKLREMESNLESKSNELVSAERSVQRHLERISRLENSLLEQQNLEEQYGTVQLQQSALNKELDRVKSQTKAKQTLLDDSLLKIRTLESAVDEKSNELAAAQRKLQLLQGSAAETENIQVVQQKLQEELDSALSKLKNEEQKSARISELNRELTAGLEKSVEDADKLKAALAEQGSLVKELETSVDAVRAEKKLLKEIAYDRSSAQEEELKQSQAELQSALGKIESLESKVTDLSNTTPASQQDQSSKSLISEEELAAMRLELNATNTALKNLESKRLALEKSNIEAIDQLDSAENELAVLEAQGDEIKNKNIELENELRKATERISELEKSENRQESVVQRAKEPAGPGIESNKITGDGAVYALGDDWAVQVSGAGPIDYIAYEEAKDFVASLPSSDSCKLFAEGFVSNQQLESSLEVNGFPVMSFWVVKGNSRLALCNVSSSTPGEYRSSVRRQRPGRSDSAIKPVKQ